MDISIGMFVKKGLPRWWVIVLCAIVGFGAAYYYTSSIIPTYYTEATLIGINLDKLITAGSVSVEEMNMSRRLATEFIPVATSRRVASEASVELVNLGHNLSAGQIQGMITAKVVTNANLITLRASSNNSRVVVDVANVVGEKFIENLNSITGVTYFSILDPAESVHTSSGVNKMLYMGAGLLAGVAIGLVLVFLMVLFDKRIKMVEDALGVKAVENLVLIPNHGIKY